MQNEILIEKLSGSSLFIKKIALKRLKKAQKADSTLIPILKKSCSIHFSSDFYYSVYSPALCAYSAYRCGQFAVGVSDYATLAYYREFTTSCNILGILYTCGYHVKCTPLFKEKKATVYGYGVPKVHVKAVHQALEPFRNDNKNYVEALIIKINNRLKKYSILISLSEVLKISKENKGGVVTEKHVCFVLAQKLINIYGRGEKLVEFLTDVLKLENCNEDLAFIKEPENKYYQQDLAKVLFRHVNIFKEEMKLRNFNEILEINKKYSIISSYGLNAEYINDGKLDEKLIKIHDAGFNAVTFDDRKIKEISLDEVVEKCYFYGLVPILLNRMAMPRQIIPSYDMNTELFNASMALVGHEISTAFDLADGFCGENTVSKVSDIKSRVNLFSNIGRKGK